MARQGLTRSMPLQRKPEHCEGTRGHTRGREVLSTEFLWVAMAILVRWATLVIPSRLQLTFLPCDNVCYRLRVKSLGTECLLL